MTRFILLVFLSALASCGPFPRDPEGTMERIQDERTFRVGIVSGLTDPSPAHAFIRRVAARTGAAAMIESGAAETLIARLDDGDIDLIIGEFGAASPWARHASFLPPLRERVSRHGNLLLVPVAKNGENAWIGLLYREAKAVRKAALP